MYKRNRKLRQINKQRNKARCALIRAYTYYLARKGGKVPYNMSSMGDMKQITAIILNHFSAKGKQNEK